MSYTDLYLATNPVAYWPLNDQAGSTSAADASGNGHAATPQGTYTLGTPGLIPAETDTAMLLNASGALNCPALSLTPPFSLSCIFNPTGDGGTTTGYGTILGYGGPSSQSRRIMWGDTRFGQRIWVEMGGANLFTPNNSVPAGQTAHIVYTNDGTTETIYINGTAAASQPNSAATWSSTFYVGTYGPVGGAYQIAATVEKVGVNNTCLNATTVASLAQEALAPPEQLPIKAMIFNGTQWVPALGLRIWIGAPGNTPTGQRVNDIWVQQ